MTGPSPVKRDMRYWVAGPVRPPDGSQVNNPRSHSITPPLVKHDVMMGAFTPLQTTYVIQLRCSLDILLYRCGRTFKFLVTQQYTQTAFVVCAASWGGCAIAEHQPAVILGRRRHAQQR